MLRGAAADEPAAGDGPTVRLSSAIDDRIDSVGATYGGDGTGRRRETDRETAGDGPGDGGSCTGRRRYGPAAGDGPAAGPAAGPATAL